ncbi:hypothetical protein GALMADRAFT_237037 [Galerina marginata CBS 339.88]|uniref:DUF5648 domain-containing protein n=1 Tax=Galerina marginata (strain CBS 339.88) TaxID=685588 RepID=A0A067TM19_GALM3|nr:hypothetical protein GALMADRAFT_237037 [Galerina marginata CBS 339.88]
MKFTSAVFVSLSMIINGAFSMPKIEARSLEARRVADSQACGDPRLLVPLFRLWNPVKKDDFYTTSAPEKQNAIANDGYSDEGVAGYVWPTSTAGGQLQTIPFYRVYNPTVVNHFYTTSTAERDNAVNNLGYNNEGIAGYVYGDAQCDGLPLYRLWSAKAQNDFYTMDAQEVQDVISGDADGYSNEGIRAYIFRF